MTVCLRYHINNILSKHILSGYKRRYLRIFITVIINVITSAEEEGYATGSVPLFVRISVDWVTERVMIAF